MLSLLDFDLTCIQILDTAFKIAASTNSQENQQYWVLLIITDGIINDMRQTIDSIVRNNSLPLVRLEEISFLCLIHTLKSVVIVGVGNADFTNMGILDGDDVQLKDSKGNVAKRDIIQVSFSSYEIRIFSFKLLSLYLCENTNLPKDSNCPKQL